MPTYQWNKAQYDTLVAAINAARNYAKATHQGTDNCEFVCDSTARNTIVRVYAFDVAPGPEASTQETVIVQRYNNNIA